MESKTKKHALTTAGVLSALVALLFIIGSPRVVNEGERGVKTRLGKIKAESVEPGLHFKLPLVDSIVKYDVRVQKQQGETEAFSSDVQQAKVNYAITYRIDPKKTGDVYRTYGTKEEMESVLLAPLVLSNLKNTLGQTKAEELVATREQAAKKVLDALRKGTTEKGEPVEIKEFSLQNIDFSDSFEKSVEDKVIAGQEAKKEENRIAMREAEAKQKVIEAEGEAKKTIIKAEAEAQKTVIQAEAEAKALNVLGKELEGNPKVMALRAVEKWDGKLPSVVGGNSSNLVNISEFLNKEKQNQRQ